MTNLLLTLFVPYLLAGADPAPKAPEIVYVKFGMIKVNGETFKKDIVIENGKVKKRGEVGEKSGTEVVSGIRTPSLILCASWKTRMLVFQSLRTTGIVWHYSCFVPPGHASTQRKHTGPR